MLWFVVCWFFSFCVSCLWALCLIDKLSFHVSSDIHLTFFIVGFFLFSLVIPHQEESYFTCVVICHVLNLYSLKRENKFPKWTKEYFEDIYQVLWFIMCIWPAPFFLENDAFSAEAYALWLLGCIFSLDKKKHTALNFIGFQNANTIAFLHSDTYCVTNLQFWSSIWFEKPKDVFRVGWRIPVDW